MLLQDITSFTDRTGIRQNLLLGSKIFVFEYLWGALGDFFLCIVDVKDNQLVIICMYSIISL